jgi:hypothetical protein
MAQLLSTNSITNNNKILLSVAPLAIVPICKKV